LKIWKDHILKVLNEAEGNQSKASQMLGIDRKTLYLKLKKYGMGLSSRLCYSNELLARLFDHDTAMIEGCISQR
jgi:hypothetical protein